MDPDNNQIGIVKMVSSREAKLLKIRCQNLDVS